MNKKKWIEKGSELQRFEEQILSLARERVKKYIVKLEELGLAIDIELMWGIFPDCTSYARIKFEEGYICYLTCQIRKMNEPKQDLDLTAITFSHPITRVARMWYQFVIHFSKVPQKYLTEYLASIDETVNRVLEEGYQVVLNEIKQEKF